MPMSSNESINKKITQTEVELNNIRALDNSSPIKSLMLEELKFRLSQLEEEKQRIAESEAKETIRLRLYGQQIESGKISSRTFLSILGGFQSMADIMADFVVRSTISENGKINKELKSIVSNLSDFNIVETFAGSFGVVLEKDYGQIGMTAGASKETQVLDDLFSVIENSQDVSCLIETIVPYGKRAVQHYKDWIENIKENDINVEINWIDSSAASRRVDIKSTMAGNIISTLNDIDTAEEFDLDLVGTLTGINTRKNSFEIKSEDEGIIKGRASIETLIASSNFLNQRMIAALTKSVFYSRDRIPKVIWYLKGVNEFREA